jgi:hypothetical protein
MRPEKERKDLVGLLNLALVLTRLHKGNLGVLLSLLKFTEPCLAGGR